MQKRCIRILYVRQAALYMWHTRRDDDVGVVAF